MALIPTTDVQKRVDMMLTNRGYIVDKVKPMLMEGIDVSSPPGMSRPSLRGPRALKFAEILGLKAKSEVDNETKEMIGDEANGKTCFAFVPNLFPGRLAEASGW